jgi:glycosyltransferase involved in cell wall biosynthesis/SAM-dependent methyltransferase
MDVCTIIAKNYVASARVLARSFARQHPDDRFHVLVIDDIEGWIDPAEEPFELVRIEQLGIPDFPRMAALYDVLELSTAVKPWLLRHLLRDSGDGAVVYLDPDMRLYAPLDDMFARVREHGLVLSPHNVDPMPRDGKKPDEQDILVAGVYNLGFIGIGSGAFADELLDWWSVRLDTDCIVAPERGFFVDQRWIDLVPGLAESFHLLRDRGFNVAYWNLATRPVSERDGAWRAGDAPLRLFHFSGYDTRTPHVLSKHQNRIRLGDHPDLARLCAAYADELRAEGIDEARDWPYTYVTTASGMPLDGLVRRLYRELVLEGFEGSLFTPEGEAAFVEAANGPATRGGGGRGVTRYLEMVYDKRSDVRLAYPDLDGPAGDAFLRWAREYGPPELGVPEVFLPPAPAAPAPAPAAPVAPPADPAAELAALEPPRAPFGVNVAGYLNAELGVGEVARQAIGALDAVGVPVRPIGVHAPGSRHGHAFAAAGPGEHGYGVNLVCVNADMLPAFAREVGPGFFRGRHTIGWWWWEIAAFPDSLHAAFAHVDEVWAGSRFVADAIAAASPVPVVRMPMPVSFPQWPEPARAELGLPEGFVVLFTWDYNSVARRKNPLGALEAFLRAFPDPGEGATLVLKCINAERWPNDFDALRVAAAAAPHVRIMDGYLEPGDKDRLLASCDCYLSLHRSEGFGIGMAEAMLLGKPVVATGYSGNLDFMTEANAYLVDHVLVPVGPGAAPYAATEEWAEPDLDHAAAQLRRVFTDRDEAAARGARAAQDIAARHSPAAAGEVMTRRLRGLAPTGADGAGDGPAAGGVAELIGRHPRSASTVPGRAAAQRAALRLMRPHTAHQEQVDRALVDAIAELDERVGRLDHGQGRLTADLLGAEATALRELRRLGARVTALEGIAARERIADLATQVDALRQAVDAHRGALEAGALLTGPAVAAADAYAPVAAEPWSHAYNDAHRAFVARELDDALLLEAFRRGRPLPDGFGVGLDERVVEFPWVAAQVLSGVVLDAGSTLNHAHVLERLRPRCDALDIVTLAPEPASFPQLGISYLYADLRDLPVRSERYDRVVSLSTLEHVGLDVSHFGAEAAAADPQAGLLAAIAELHRVLKPGGELLLSVPVGRGDRYAWVRNLSLAELDEAVEAFAPATRDATYFRYAATGWQAVDRDAVRDARYRDHLTAPPPDGGPVAAEAVACLRLVK